MNTADKKQFKEWLDAHPKFSNEVVLFKMRNDVFDGLAVTADVRLMNVVASAVDPAHYIGYLVAAVQKT